MIKGLSVDTQRALTPPTPAKTSKAAERQNDFAEQLLGAKSEPLEKPDRNERRTSGRDSDRGEYRSAEREKASSKSSDYRKPREEERSAKRESYDSYNSASMPNPPSQPIPTSRMPSSEEEPPIVIENPKSSDSQDSNEMKLPDFFSKASIESGRKAGDGSIKLGGEAAESADLLASVKDGESLTRQQAMSDFVEQMQDELGIPPEKILAAFAQLDDSAMKAPPEQSMGQFMKALDLDPAKEARATELYQDLLKTTNDSLMNERVASMGQGVNFDVMSPRDAALKKLHSSLDDLNKSFFRKGGESADAKKAQSAMESMDVELAKLIRAKTDGLPKDAQANAQMNAQALAQSAMLDDANDSDDGTVSGATIGADSLAELMATKQNPLAAAMNGGGGEGDLADLGRESASSTKSVSTQSALKSAFAEEMSKELKDEDGDADGVDAQSLAKGADAKMDPTAVDSSSQAVPGAAKSAVLGPSDMMMNRQATPAEEQDNVRELIKQAQIMVKRGGGEMKLEMKPEGMGQIQLRVNVENGQVNVQMLTESESAKHLIEKGLSELKTNLAAHELKVQSLSVDVGNDVKNQMDHQGTQDHARQQARQFAQDFMGSFHDDRQSMRQSMMDNHGWRSYGRNQERGDVSEKVAQASAKAASKARSDRRLNLVA